MKYIFFFIPLFMLQNAIGQQIHSKCFYYNLAFVPDSLYPARLYKESFVLIVEDSITFFSSTNYLKLKESIGGLERKASIGQISSIGGVSLPKTGFKFIIYNLQSSSKTIQIMDLITQKYGVEYPPLYWQIIGDTQTIAGLKCKNASINFGGRDYTAWFSEEIPFAEGPYIFKGLPGLIVQIYDSKGHYKWELTNITDRKDVWSIDYNKRGIEWIRRGEMIKLNSYDGRRSRLDEVGIFDSEWSGIGKEELIRLTEINLRRNNNQIELKE